MIVHYHLDDNIDLPINTEDTIWLNISNNDSQYKQLYTSNKELMDTIINQIYLKNK